MWYISRQSIEVAMAYGFKWDCGNHMSNEGNDPLHLVVMQPLGDAILCKVTIGRGPWGPPQNAPRRMDSDCKGGPHANSPRDDGARVCLCATEDRVQVPGPKLVEAYHNLHLWRN